MDNDHTCVCVDRHVDHHWFCHCRQPLYGQSQRSAGRLSECGGADRGEAGCQGVDTPMGKAAPKFYNYIGTIFIFILVSNISGLLGLRPPTADYGVTLPLGVLTFLLIHYNQFKYQKPKEIWEGMCSPLPPWLPIWLPINLISEIAVPISLSLRLFANVLSGTVMMALIYGLLGVIATAWPAALHVYFDLFSGAIQTYVFCMLTMTYIANARGDA